MTCYKFSALIKGQITSKGRFGILGFFQKNERTNSFLVLLSKKKNVFSFFGRIRGYQKLFPNYLTLLVVIFKVHKYFLEKSPFHVPQCIEFLSKRAKISYLVKGNINCP